MSSIYDVLMITPPLGDPNKHPRPPFWYLFLKPHLDQSKISSKFIDMRPIGISKQLQAIRLLFEEDKFPIVAITLMTGTQIKGALQISEEARNAGKIIVWGGVHPSLLPEETLRTAPVDYIVVGEGEHAFPSLVSKLLAKQKIDDLPGIAYIHDNNYCFTPSQGFINLDNEPLPAWESLTNEQLQGYAGPNADSINLYTSRGCPFQCSFCYNQKYNKRRWRASTPEAVLTQVEMLKNRLPKLRSISFVDDNFVAEDVPKIFSSGISYTTIT